MTPEQKARQQIERQLEQAGWIVQDYRQMNITAGLGVAVREFPLNTGDADYMLYADATAIGVVEAKPKGHTLTGVETQSGKYLDGLPAGLPHHRLPLPFAYESTGEVTQFTNTLEADARSRAVFTFHRPEELIRLAKLDQQVRTRLREMPPLNTGNLWRVQIESIQNLEQSLALNKPRALIQMATGSGKTYTAVNRPESLLRLWQAFEVVEPDKVRGKGGKQLVDVIALVRHAIDPNTPLAPVVMTVEERYQEWIADKQQAGVTFTTDQQKWLDAIKDHIASSLAIEQDDLEEVPFNSIGGLGRAYELFGDKLPAILDELNMRLAA